MEQLTAGDVVRHTGKTFNSMYPQAVGVVESVTKESNGTFARVTWTVELDLLGRRALATAKANGATGHYHQFTQLAVAVRYLEEVK